MKILGAVVFSLLLVSFAQAQTQSAKPPETPQEAPKQAAPEAASSSAAGSAGIGPAKEADIRRLLEVAGTKAMMSEIMGNMEKNLKPMLTSSLPPGDYREKLIDLFLEKFAPRATDMIPELENMAVASYDKHLSDEDVKGLIQFYQTPLGQKTISVLPQIILEMQTAGQKVGERIGREVMLQVLSEHPELVKEMQTSRTAPPPAPAR